MYKFTGSVRKVDPQMCFVIMPFDPLMRRYYDKGIVEACKLAGMRCERVDAEVRSTHIMQDIYNRIVNAGVVVADITGCNPNVMYELGICHGLDKQVVIVKHRVDARTPFDVAHVRYNEYEDSEDLRDKLARVLGVLGEVGAVGAPDPELRSRLARAAASWNVAKENTLSLEHYLELVIALEDLAPTSEELAALLCASAHYGKLMRRMCAVCHDDPIAIAALVENAASNTYTRAPWRAGVMLAHCSSTIVLETIRGFTGAVNNPEIFPDAVMGNTVLQLLDEKLFDPQLPDAIRAKFVEVRKQIRLEFGD